MSDGGLAVRWLAALRATLEAHDPEALALRDAALAGKLAQWTSALTRVVVATCQAMGWHGAAKAHRSEVQPVRRQEYLSLDVMAFDRSTARRWQFPMAAIELENQRSDDFVAYSLWKVLCVRAALRVVFCYRRDAAIGVELVRHLGDEVIGSLTILERERLGGETLLVVGSRSQAETFPYGFFHPWLLDHNTGRFGRID